MLPAATPTWEMSNMSDSGGLRGKALYAALMRLKPHDLAETEWATQAKVNRGFFTNLKNQDISPRSDTLYKLLRLIGKSEADLYAGFDSTQTPDILPTRNSDAGSIPLRLLDLDLSMGDGTNIDDYAEEGTIDFDANLLRTITRTPPDRLYVARGSGDSMFPTLVNGDMVLIDPLQRVLNLQDRIWAISLFGAGGIKRLQPVGQGRIEVVSDNPMRDNRVIDAEDLRILGRVIWVGREV